MRRRALILALLWGLQACVFFPQQTTVSVPECQGEHKKLVLALDNGMQGFRGCNGEACAAILVAVGAVAATSFVVSGSIVLLGNTVYWLERSVNCKKPE